MPKCKLSLAEKELFWLPNTVLADKSIVISHILEFPYIFVKNLQPRLSMFVNLAEIIIIKNPWDIVLLCFMIIYLPQNYFKNLL